MRRYWLLILGPLIAYAMWLAVWSQLAMVTTYNRWWEFLTEPGVRLGVDQTRSVSLALGHASARLKAYLPDHTFGPWHDRQLRWEFAYTSLGWRPHWPRSEFFLFPVVLLVAAVVLRISLYWSVGTCALLSTRKSRVANLWRSAWNLSVSQLLSFGAGLALVALAIPASAVIDMDFGELTLSAVSTVATAAGVAVQALIAVILSGAIGDSCGAYDQRSGWRALNVVLLITFASLIIFAAGVIGAVAHSALNL